LPSARRLPTARRLRRRQKGLRCLVVGAGEAGRALARDLRRTPEFGLDPIGFLDDDPTARRRAVPGVPVLGGTGDLVRIAEQKLVDVVIVAIPSLPAAQIRGLALAGAAAGASVRYLPTFVAALERDARVSDLRHMRVDHLLGRQEMRVVRTASRAVVAGKRVLVTGAGGSIGSELCRQIAAFEPAALYLLDHDESNLHRLQLQLDGRALLDSDKLIIADIRDRERIRQLFGDHRPEVVFHAAAHKHLPLLEQHPCEGVKSNVLGTLNLVEAAVETGVERFILISTDKAADPSSVLGATKRLAEMILQARKEGPTRFAAVRFGNVLGSRGSFLSVLSEQLENGEAVTVTHPDVSRFFMTVEEAVGLVIEAASMAEGGEVFVLDMGEPVRIVDLVHNYAAQIHLDADDVTIRYTGLRPGEKLSESLFSEHESRVPTAHPKIWSTTPPRSAGEDSAWRLEELLEAAAANHAQEVRRRLFELVPGYTPPTSDTASAASLAAPYPDGF
jgi:FlaA1/EpsC-like NDP-sugar epimerase